MPLLSRQTETRFAIPYRETPRVDPKLCSTHRAALEAAVIREIFEVGVAGGEEAGGMTVGIAEGIVKLTSEIEEIPPIGMIAVESVTAPNGATAREIVSEDVDPPPVDARHSGGTSEIRETHATALLVSMLRGLGADPEMGLSLLDRLLPIRPLRIPRTGVGTTVAVEEAAAEGIGIVVADVPSTMTGRGMVPLSALGHRRAVSEIGMTVNEITGIPSPTYAHET